MASMDISLFIQILTLHLIWNMSSMDFMCITCHYFATYACWELMSAMMRTSLLLAPRAWWEWRVIYMLRAVMPWTGVCPMWESNFRLEVHNFSKLQMAYFADELPEGWNQKLLKHASRGCPFKVRRNYTKQCLSCFYVNKKTRKPDYPYQISKCESRFFLSTHFSRVFLDHANHLWEMKSQSLLLH